VTVHLEVCYMAQDALLESTPPRGVQAPPSGIRAGGLRRGCFKEPNFFAMQA